ncbi:hypothetical protein SKAU_G00086800 [Synaphobranchus kaupii]|uniref:Uncharacterized protein n=1 Tax=Synaphobranchus kaupii TaxID=118154 RepID=A0A9Q1FW30_SYNKA|nr:hypothetical protein SKAU_G00086800 [Synaphobranchus kaupii]
MNSGKRHEELSNEAGCVNYRRACSQEPSPPLAYPPLKYLPQNPYTEHHYDSDPYSYSASPVPYAVPKEQCVS